MNDAIPVITHIKCYGDHCSYECFYYVEDVEFSNKHYCELYDDMLDEDGEGTLRGKGCLEGQKILDKMCLSAYNEGYYVKERNNGA